MDQSVINSLVASGAECVGGQFMHNRKVVAILRDEQVILTPEGNVLLRMRAAKAQAEDAVVKHETVNPPAEVTHVADATEVVKPAAGLKAPRKAKAAPVAVEPQDTTETFVRTSAEITDPADLASLLNAPDGPSPVAAR